VAGKRRTLVVDEVGDKEGHAGTLKTLEDWVWTPNFLPSGMEIFRRVLTIEKYFESQF
jgi:hypothetical protein